MAKRKKGALDQILNIAGDVSKVTKIIPDAKEAYDIGKDVYGNAKNELEINNKINKIKELLIEIGDKVVKKNIEINNKDIDAEIVCIKELQEEIEKLK